MGQSDSGVPVYTEVFLYMHAYHILQDKQARQTKEGSISRASTPPKSSLAQERSLSLRIPHFLGPV